MTVPSEYQPVNPPVATPPQPNVAAPVTPPPAQPQGPPQFTTGPAQSAYRQTTTGHRNFSIITAIIFAAIPIIGIIVLIAIIAFVGLSTGGR